MGVWRKEGESWWGVWRKEGGGRGVGGPGGGRPGGAGRAWSSRVGWWDSWPGGVGRAGIVGCRLAGWEGGGTNIHTARKGICMEE